MTPSPPSFPSAIAVRESVTVSMAAETIGMARRSSLVSRVAVETGVGRMSLRAGMRRTSSKVKPSFENFSSGLTAAPPSPGQVYLEGRRRARPGAQWLPASRPTEIVLVAETVVGTHASNATRPPHTRMLRATRTTRSGRTRISVPPAGRLSVVRRHGPKALSVGRARSPSPARGSCRYWAVRLLRRRSPYDVPPPAHAFSISTRSLVHERARHQNTVAVERPMRHAPGRTTSWRSTNRSNRCATTASATKMSASTSSRTTRKMSANDAAPNVFFRRYGNAMSSRLMTGRMLEERRGPFGSNADHSDRRADRLLDTGQIRARFLRQAGTVVHARDRLEPARERLVAGTHPLERRRGRHVARAPAVELVLGAERDPFVDVEHVELGDRDLGEGVQAVRVPRRDRIEPADASRTAGRRAVLAGALAELVGLTPVQLRRERPLAHGGRVRLHDADHPRDEPRRAARADPRAPRQRIRARHVPIDAPVEVAHRAQLTPEEGRGLARASA